MEKTSTTSRCLTYTFLTDEDGFKTVRQASRLKLADTVGYHQDFVWVDFCTALNCTGLYCRYTGQLASPEQFSAPARMTVQFPLSQFQLYTGQHTNLPISDLVGRASFVVLDTDYTSRALVCSCQVGYWSVGWSDDIPLPGGEPVVRGLPAPALLLHPAAQPRPRP